MEWIKIKSEHNSDELSDAQFGSLVRYQLLIARIGRTPTDKEIRRQTSIKTLRSAEEVLSNIGATLEHIESKVIEDREQVQRNKEVSKKTSSKYRDTRKSDTSLERHSGITEKRREEENINTNVLSDDNVSKIITNWQKIRKDDFFINGKFSTGIVINRRKEIENKSLEQVKLLLKTYNLNLNDDFTFTKEYSEEEKRMIARGLCLD
jgi:hypothetical protein